MVSPVRKLSESQNTALQRQPSECFFAAGVMKRSREGEWR